MPPLPAQRLGDQHRRADADDPRGVLAVFILVVAGESGISPVRVLRAARGQPAVEKETLLRRVMAIALTLSLLPLA